MNQPERGAVAKFLHNADSVDTKDANIEEYLDGLDKKTIKHVKVRNAVFAWRYLSERCNRFFEIHDMLVIHRRLGIGIYREGGGELKSPELENELKGYIKSLKTRSGADPYSDFLKISPFSHLNEKVARFLWAWDRLRMGEILNDGKIQPGS